MSETSTDQPQECPLCRGSGEIGGSVCEGCGGYGDIYHTELPQGGDSS